MTGALTRLLAAALGAILLGAAYLVVVGQAGRTEAMVRSTTQSNSRWVPGIET